jgi:class 3 adenylate cyclase/CHASE2 domain-containing sensor protein
MTIGVIVTALMTWLAVELYARQHHAKEIDSSSILGIFDEIHRKSIDFRFLNRGESRGSPRVAILAIDDASIEREGRWPWPREKIGRLIENAVDAGAKILAFDVVFSEADQNSSSRTLSNLKINLTKMSKGSLDHEVEALLDKEIEAGNSDKKLASTVGLYQDAVVMGTYYDTESHDNGVELNPLRDYCLDAQYGRTFEKKYWDKEEIFPIVVDPVYNGEGADRPPEELLERVANHITGLEVTKASMWFEANGTASKSIEESLKMLEVDISSEDVPFFFVWANIGDEESLFARLSDDPNLKRFANRPMILQIFSTVLRSLTTPQVADLRQTIGREVALYCQRFLTAGDDLLNRDKFYAGVDQPKEVLDADWELRGLEPAWDKLIKEKGRAPIPLATAISNWRSRALVNPIEPFEKTWISVPEVAATTKHTGYFNAALDPDGTVRRSRLIARRGHVYVPSLSLKTFLLDRKLGVRFKLEREPSTRDSVKREMVQTVEFTNAAGKVVMNAPVDSNGLLMINYSGPQQMFDYISASSLLSNDKDISVSHHPLNAGSGATATEKVDRKEFLKDKILIVGATSIGVYDLRQTPFEENYPGVETHANVLSNLLTEEARATGQPYNLGQPGFLKIHPIEEKIMWVVLLAGGLALSAALTYLGSIAGLLLTLTALLSFYFIDRYVLFANGFIVNVSLPFITVCALFVGITSYKYFTEERNKRALKSTFAKYVSPSVVEEILKDPSNIELGGKKMELTVMFSDVRGFTTISEKLDPRALSNLLNSYLTPMTDLVFETKGTLDKYMGDAIMAFWGAPIQFEDHAERAATCALMMLQKLKLLQDEYKAKGLPTIDIGIGLNTGDMSVGNMGSNTVRSYTVMGDSVNLGSRLEGINKEYGTRIIVSEFTESRISKSFVTREVDWVRVKGKAQPVRIFELLGTKNSGTLSATNDMLAVLPDFEAGFRLYHARKFDEAVNAFTRALNTKPDDECSQLYIERCQDYIKAEPPEDWDGVYTMKTK